MTNKLDKILLASIFIAGIGLWKGVTWIGQTKETKYVKSAKYVLETNDFGINPEFEKFVVKDTYVFLRNPNNIKLKDNRNYDLKIKIPNAHSLIGNELIYANPSQKHESEILLGKKYSPKN